jgi:hypothetical protein
MDISSELMVELRFWTCKRAIASGLSLACKDMADQLAGLNR